MCFSFSVALIQLHSFEGADILSRPILRKISSHLLVGQDAGGASCGDDVDAAAQTGVQYRHCGAARSIQGTSCEVISPGMTCLDCPESSH
jgi:hypothetical protein